MIVPNCCIAIECLSNTSRLISSERFLDIDESTSPQANMFGPKSNIFVSICPGYEYAQGAEKRYLTPHLTWMLTIECPKYSLPGVQRRDPNPTHYSIIWDDEEDRYRLRRVTPTNFGIAGSILIERNSHASTQKIFAELEAGLKAFQSDADAIDDSEHWMRAALHTLQQHDIVQTFDVEMFMAFTQAYLTRRMDGEGPARIAYSRFHKDHSEKEKKGFWVSYPQASVYQERSDVYGGLM